MNGSERTRRSGRLSLVESMALAEEDRMWLPYDPCAYARIGPGRFYTSFEYYEAIVGGRTPAWKRRYLTVNAALAAVAAGFMVLQVWFFAYGPGLGLDVAASVFCVVVAVLSVAALWLGRALMQLETGSLVQARRYNSQAGRTSSVP